MYFSSEEISDNQDNIQSSSSSLKYEYSQNEIQSVRGFKIAHVNTRSLLKHIDEFRIFLRKKQLGDFNCDWLKQGTQSYVDKLRDVMVLYQF